MALSINMWSSPENFSNGVRSRQESVAACFDYSGRLSGQSSPLPIFAFALAGFVCIHSAGIVPEAIETALNAASRWRLIPAIAAVGMTTSLQALAKLGWRPVVVVIASSAALVLVVAGSLWMMRAH